MLYLVHRVTISIKLRPVKLEQAVSESLPHKGLYSELLWVQLTCLDPVPASIRARNAQEINITNCDVTTWSWVNLVHPLVADAPVSTSISTSTALRSILTVRGWAERRWSLSRYKYSGYSWARLGACSSDVEEASSP